MGTSLIDLLKCAYLGKGLYVANSLMADSVVARVACNTYCSTPCEQVGADYGLGTVGTCLGSPLAGGPHLTKRNLYEKKRLNDKNGGIVGRIILFVNYKASGLYKGPLKNRFLTLVRGAGYL